MRYLIRFVTRRLGGALEQHDRVFEGDAVTLGRATDQVLHLKDRRVALEHARIEPRNAEFRITTDTLTGLIVNGRSCREAALRPADLIEVGANLITVIDPPPGFDFAFTFELRPEAKTEDVASPWGAQSLGEGARWGKRRWSWVGAVAILAVGLIVPGAGILNPPLATFLRGSPLPDDGWWLAGPLHAMHSGASAACEDCHQTPFVRVRDAQCLACHDVDRHVVAASGTNAGGATAALGGIRCASCHLEHNEPPALVKTHQGLCTDCHADLSATSPALDTRDVSDFLGGHPEFRVSLLAPKPADSAMTTWQTDRRSVPIPQLTEQSNLTFPHAAHLAPGGIATPEGDRELACGDCHTLEPGGARFEPIAMEAHCSGCHTLTFDPADPAREVPHGEPDAVVQSLIEYYSARLLGGEPQAQGPRILRPGRPISPAERDRAAAEAREQALAVAQDLFERRACATCHQVTRLDADGPARWQVVPVALTREFLPHARFSHEAHDTEASRCVDCHAAADSEQSADVLLPSIDTCRDCHGSAVASRNRAEQTPSTCILCHRFHLPAKGPYR